MEDREMTPAERRATDAANRIFADILGDFFPAPPRRGRQRRKYHYYQTPDQWRFCYTPWKDVNGDYFTFIYKPYGKGSQSGKAIRWRMKDKVRARTRKTAKARAYKRYQRRLKIYHGQTQDHS